MSAGWVAGSVRARLLADHALGRERALGLASSPSLEAAIGALAGTVYGERLRPGHGLEQAQRAVRETLLWQLRVLAGWLPPAAASRARVFAAWFEIANVDRRLAELAGAPSRRPFDLGRLGSAAAPRIAEAGSAEAVRSALAGSEWGDPGDAAPGAIARWLRISWARRMLASAPESRSWTLGAVALLLARDLAADRPVVAPRPRLPELGRGPWEAARDVGELGTGAAGRCPWPLTAPERADGLWAAEAVWWRRVETDARRMLREGHAGPRRLTGAAALLACDARRVAGGLAVAARGSTETLREAFDAAA